MKPTTPTLPLDGLTDASTLSGSRLFRHHTKRKLAKKLLIVDNLSSHISAEVIELCQRHNVAYVCLPLKSTDKLQPLDVGVFGTMKHAWRNQLRAYSDKDPAADLVMATISKRRQNEASILTLFSISKRNEPAYSRTCKDRSEANPA